ncbi:MAG: DNA mismatch repair endonuclease MutL [Thermoplasmata archaeon]|nr:DNA mismatch repair endonuclease MutL [Thermoplasmata archaeon]
MSRSAPPKRRPIRRLDAATVERIAAGEVVERPASVVKELIENALDAGATTVAIGIEEGGISRVEVSDDGAGIPSAELPLALERHATSKLDPAGPVDRIESLGFRGEALAAIGTVSRLRIVSRTPDRDEATSLTVEGGTLGEPSPAGRSVGTTVEVHDLFFNTPARRKFLRSPAAEQIEVVATVERVYLARPDVTYRIRSGERELAVYPATTDLRDAATRVLGPSLLRESFEVEGAVPGGRLRGTLGRPATAASSSRGLYFSVNGRTISSRPLAQAVRAAFGDYLPRSRFPIGALALEFENDRIDVNVHPTKREVRFLRERDLAERIRVLVREALLGSPAVAEASPGATPSHPRDHAIRASTRTPPSTLAAAARAAGHQQVLPVATDLLPSRSVPVRGPHPRLELIGCVGAIYWVAETEDGMVLIDQHAASERVVYDALRRNGTLARQTLMSPVLVPLSGAQRAALEQHGTAVRAAGFDVDEFGPGTYRIRSVPAYRGQTARPEGLGELLTELAEGGRPTLPDGLEERTAASIACHAAIRAGDVVEREAFARVLDALHQLAESSYSCPHGRPIQVRLSRSRIDRWFLRSGT